MIFFDSVVAGGTCLLRATDPLAPFVDATDGSRRPYYAPVEIIRRDMTNKWTEFEIDLVTLPIIQSNDRFNSYEHVSLGLDISVYPWLPFEPNEHTALAFTIAHRLYMLEGLVHDTSCSNMLRLSASHWANAHIPITCFLEHEGNYTDDVVLKYLPGMEPSCDLIVHPGCLPNMTMFLMSFGTSDAEAEQSNIKTKLKRLILKPMPQRCIGRGFGPLALKTAEEHSNIAQLMLQVVIVGLLGGYESINVRPPFAVRKHIYSMMVLQRCDIINILTQLKGALFHIIREFIVFNVNCIGPLSTAIGSAYPWTEFCVSTSCTVDSMRARVCRNFDRLTRTGMPRGSVNEIFCGLNNIKPTTVPKRQKPPENCVSRVIQVVTHSVQEHVISQMDVSGSVHKQFIDVSKAAIDGVELCTAIIKLAEPPFDINLEFVKTLAQYVKAYSNDGNKDKIHSLILNLAKTNVREYEKLCVFVNQATVRDSIRKVRLPDGIRDLQVTALEKIVKHAYNGDVTKASMPSKFAVCTVCLRFCGFISSVTPGHKSSKVSDMRAMGHKRLLAIPNMLDVHSVTYTCGIRSDRTDSKRRSVNVDPVTSHGEVPPDKLRESRKRARETRALHQQRTCRDTPVQFIDMIGTAIEITNQSGVGKLIQLCTTCAQPYEYNPRTSECDSICEQCDMTSRRIPVIIEHCVMCSMPMPTSMYSRRWNSRDVIDNLEVDSRPRWFDNWNVPGTCMRTVWFCPRHINHWVMGSPVPLPLDAVLYSLRKDPKTGMFAITSFMVGDTHVPTERMWSLKQPLITHRPAMFVMERVTS